MSTAPLSTPAHDPFDRSGSRSRGHRAFGAERRPLHVLMVQNGFHDAHRIEPYLNRDAFAVTRWDGIGARGGARRDGDPEVALVRLSSASNAELAKLDAVRRELPRVPVVVITDGEDDPCARAALRAGARDHLGLDDLTHALLVRTLRHVVASHRLEREATIREERYRALLEHARNGTMSLDAVGTIRYANAAAAEIIGRPVARILGKNVLELAAPSDTPASEALLRRVLDAPAEQHTGFLELQGADGKPRHLELRVRNHLDTPNVAALLVNVTDVTEHVEDQRSLADNEARYRHLFDNSLDGVAHTAPDGRIFEMNPAFLAMLGYTRAEAEERQLHRDDVLDLSDPRLPAILEERRRTGRFRGELNLRHKDGTIIPTELTSNIHLDADGNERTSMIVRDMTERHRIEKALDDHRSHHARAEKVSLTMVVDATLGGRLMKVPPGLCELLGYDEHELLARTIQDITHPDDLDETLRRLQEVRDGSASAFEMDKRYLRKDGAYVWAHVSVSMLTSRSGEPLHVRMYLRDTSADKAAEEQVLRHYALLLQQVTRLAEQVGLAEDQAGVHRALLELARTTTPADSLVVSHYEPDANQRRCVFVGEFVDGRYEEPDVGELPPMPLNDSPASRAVRERRAVNTADLWQLELPYVDVEGGEGNDAYMRASLAIPLIVRGEVLGVFEVQSARPGVFTEEHIAKLHMAANLAAIAMKNVDLLARQRAARKNAEHQATRLQAVLEQAPTLTASIEGPEHVFTMANDNYLRLFGGRELIGRRVADAMPELAGQGIIDVLDGVFASGETFVSHEFPMNLDTVGDGGPLRRYFDLVYQPLRDEDGDVTGVLAQAVDITAQVEARKRAEELHAEVQVAYDGTIAGWARALDLKDEETAGHSQRVTNLTLELSRRMGMSDGELVHVRRGALLHDIGKMGVPDRILLKPGALDAHEWETMKRHTVYARDFLEPIEYLRPALDIPYCHHEKWDGSGYPRGLAGEDIPLAARIFAVTDVYDALTNDRPYRAAWSCEQALAFIRERSGTHFDPEVVEAFLHIHRDAR